MHDPYYTNWKTLGKPVKLDISSIVCDAIDPNQIQQIQRIQQIQQIQQIQRIQRIQQKLFDRLALSPHSNFINTGLVIVLEQNGKTISKVPTVSTV